MQLKAEITFAEPDDYPVTLKLTGTLAGFERLAAAISKSDIPHYEVDNLVSALRETSNGLRRQVRHEAEPTP